MLQCNLWVPENVPIRRTVILLEESTVSLRRSPGSHTNPTITLRSTTCSDAGVRIAIKFDNVVVVLRLTCLIVVLALLIFALGIASSIVFRFLVCYFGILDPCCFVACSCGLYVFCRSQFLGCQSFILHSNKDLTSVGVAQSGHICCHIHKNKDTSDWLTFCTSVLLRASFCVCPDCHQGNTVVTLKWTKIHLNHSHFARR